jgi:pimeloyl-ACP methyl ester carboxylesterase
MRERAIRFGSNAMVGVLTEPDKDQGLAGAPAVLFLNAGLLHRVGACRFHVRTARALAPAGFTSLRFDFSGNGDSEPRKDGMSFEQAAVAEAQEAMSYLEKTRGAKSFVLIGLCSGADMAYETALVDKRVEAIGQLDAYVYRTWRFYVHRYGPRLLRAQSWRNILTRNVRRLLKARQGGDEPGGEDEEDKKNLSISPYAREFPPKEKVAAGLKVLVNRGVRLFNFFSNDYYMYRSQYRDCFSDISFRDQLRLEFIPGADHLVSKLSDQQYLVSAMADWVRSLHPAAARAGAQASMPTSAALTDQSRSRVATS